MLYTDTRSMVQSPDGYIDFFEITSGVLFKAILQLLTFHHMP